MSPSSGKATLLTTVFQEMPVPLTCTDTLLGTFIPSLAATVTEITLAVPRKSNCKKSFQFDPTLM